MLGVRYGHAARLVLVLVLLVPAALAVAAVPRSAGPAWEPDGNPGCVVSPAPTLGVDLARACRAVRAAVPSWLGTARLVLGAGDPLVAADSLGSTITVHAAAWRTLSEAGRQAVLTHELVHVATDALTTQRTPPWLVEGLAEAVAWRDVRLPDRVVARELAVEVHAGRLPAALPTQADFGAHPERAYPQSWIAVDLLLRHLGDAAVLALYRDAGSMPLSRALSRAVSRAASSSGARTRSGAFAPDLVQTAGAEALLRAAWRAELVRRLG